MLGAEHDIGQGQARLRGACDRHRNSKQSAHGDSTAKQRLQKLMASKPGQGCGGYGHWSYDPERLRSQNKPASNANVPSAPKDGVNPLPTNSVGPGKAAAVLEFCRLTKATVSRKRGPPEMASWHRGDVFEATHQRNFCPQ